MSHTGNKAELLAERLDMPADVIGGAPKLTLSGRRHLMIENHRGILSYGDELIELDCAGMKVNIRGDGLCLGAMDKRDMVITGRILVIELE